MQMQLTVKRFVLVLAAGLLTSSAAQAASLGVYTFTGSDTSGPAADASKPTYEHLTYTSFARVGVNASGVTDVFASRDWYDGAGDTSPTQFSDSEYVSFSVTVDTGYQLNLASLKFDASNSASGPNQVRVGYSTTEAATGSQTYTGLTTTASTKTFSFTDLTTVGTIEFRFYGAGATLNSARQILDNVTLDGTVTEVIPVPEPAAFALFGLAGLSMLRRRRR